MDIDWQSAPSTWQALIDRSPHATFFHTPAWAAMIESLGGVRCTALHARWDDGRQAIVPLTIRPIWGGLMRMASTAFEGCYGGILADGPLSDDRRAALYRAIRRRYPDVRLYGNPFEAPPPPEVGLHPSEATQLRVFPLAPLTEMRTRYRPTRRRHVKRYLADGVEVVVSRGPDDSQLPDFMRLYEHEVGFWASTEWARDAAWFQRLWRMARDRLTLYSAYKDGELAGVQLLGRQGAVATQLVLAWDRRFIDHQVSTALVERAIDDTYQQGCTHFDLMSCAGQEGIEFFKASFGAEAMPIWCDYRQSAVTSAIKAVQSFVRVLKSPGLVPTPSS